MILYALLSIPAAAVTESNKAILRLPIGNRLCDLFSCAGRCDWSNVYLDITSDAGRTYFAVLLIAYASGRPISRIDYTEAADGTCTVDLVEM